MRTRSALLRHGVPLLVICGLSFAAISCSDDDPGTQPSAGSPGSAGTVGGGGVAGSGVGGSIAGAPGTAGAGQSGASSGGTAGSGTAGNGTAGGGKGGGGGIGGATAGSGGSAGSTSGSGGTTAGGGAGGTGGATGGAPSGGTGGGGSGTLTLTSPSHAEGAKFASKYTCADKGFNGSILPELKWTPGPTGTKSYAITFIDVTLTEKNPPDQNGFHWTIYDIPPTTTSLPEGMTDAGTVGAKQTGPFLGPCPNFGGGGTLKTDTYEFTIYALSSATTTLTGGSITAQTRDADMKLEAANLAKAKLTGTSDARPPQ